MLKNGDGVNHRVYRSIKEDLFRDLHGTVVEIGPGSGINFRYFPDGKKITWIGIEPNESFHSMLTQKAKEFGITASLVSGDAENIPLPDMSADAVICTLVLCSVTKPTRALMEMKRILKPGGKLYFIEHVAAPEKTFLRNVQDLFNPLNQFFADGCNCNRETWHDLQSVGFSDVQITHREIKGILTMHKPHMFGVAVK